MTMTLPARRTGACLSAPLALLTLLASCGGSSEGTGPSSGPVLSAASSTSVTGQFGDAIPVSVTVKTAGGLPETNVTVTFAASDSGGLDAASVPTDSTGTAKVRWRLAAVTTAQTLVASVGTRKVTFTGTATTNPWTVGINAGAPAAWRPADEGSQSGSGPSWSATNLGSPPMLMVRCSGGDPDIVVTHPNMQTTNGNVSIQLDQQARVSQFWHPVLPGYDQLIAPGLTDNPNASAMDFLRRLVAAKQFNIAFRSTTANTLLAPTFGTAGLSQVLPQVLTMCPGWS